LWFPHVYETNQAPLGTSVNGTNPVGRWDFGPLFWPIFPANDALPTGEAGQVSSVPEAFMDTPLINGTAYPKLTVDPKAYRFRILNASNDRYINLALYQADPAVSAPQMDLNGNPIVDAAGKPLVMTNTEVKMVPAVGDAGGNPVGWDAKHVNADGSTGAQLPLPQYPALTTNIVAEPSGPTRAWPVDSRIGGAPDPLTAGPDFIAIGNDGGFLPHPVDIPAQPVTYESNRRSITVGNIYGYGLLLGPAERADAIVDFSAYAGQTLILYNDAPAPAPFNDVRNDYFTGGPDQTGAGGAYATKPGYGPNTRTMMQITVNSATTAKPAVPYTMATKKTAGGTDLDTALAAAYGQSQPLPIVPELAYNDAFKTTGTDNYAHVPTGSVAQPTLNFSTKGQVLLTGLTLDTAGIGYKTAPDVVFNNTGCLTGGATASATAVLDTATGKVIGFTGFNAGYGYTCEPSVTFTAPLGVTPATATVLSDSTKIEVKTKAEQELFDNHGRYNSTGGVELPLTNNVIQTTVPLNYIDSATEILEDGIPQIWKLVDNGLWSNSIHFSMADVQLINRVGWDGTVKAPANNELGWKDTLRLNPLEDVIVAVRVKRPNIPFGLPRISRPQDPSKVVGVGAAPAGQVAGPGFASGLGFTNGVGVTPLPSLTNVVADYDNEFFWGSAILGHAENDLTRPVVFKPTVTVPDAPSKLSDPSGSGVLTWTDPTPAGQLASAPGVLPVTVATMANPKNEIGFRILQAPIDANGNLGLLTPVLTPAGAAVTVPANVTHWSMQAPSTTVAYAVVAYNAAGDSLPSQPYSETPPVAPTTFTADYTPISTDAPTLVNFYNSVTLSWSGGTSSNKLELWRSAAGGAPILLTTVAGTTTGFVDNTVTALMSYTYQIKAVNAVGMATSAMLDVTTPMILVVAPTIVSAVPNNAGTSVALRWTDNANNETEYWVDVTATNSATGQITVSPQLVIPRTPKQGVATGGAMNTVIATAPGNVYTITVTAVDVTNPPTGLVNSTSTPPATINVDLSAPLAPTTPSGLKATLTSATNVSLSWVDNASTENSYLITTSNTTTGVVTTSTVNRSAAQSLATGGVVNANIQVVTGDSYSFTVMAQATRFGLTTASAAAGPTTMDVSAPVPPTGVTAVAGTPVGQIAVSWVDASSNESGFTIQRSQMSALGVWGAWANAGTVAAGVQTFTDIGRTTGRSYRYQVRANGVVGNSVWVGPSTTVIAP
jgi:FtsP/CotA-like multicopper oxidase with cupredoxin domain